MQGSCGGLRSFKVGSTRKASGVAPHDNQVTPPTKHDWWTAKFSIAASRVPHNLHKGCPEYCSNTPHHDFHKRGNLYVVEHNVVVIVSQGNVDHGLLPAAVGGMKK